MPDVEHKYRWLSDRKQNPVGGVEYLTDFLRMVRAFRCQRAAQRKSIQAFNGFERPSIQATAAHEDSAASQSYAS
jgi:hypothetical protein